MSRRGPAPPSGDDDFELVVELISEDTPGGVIEYRDYDEHREQAEQGEQGEQGEPAAPADYDGYHPPPARPPRPTTLLLLAAAAAVILVGLVYVVATTKPTAEQAGRGRTPATRPFALPPIRLASVRPTMVAPTRLPGDLDLEDGAADRAGYGNDRPTVIVWSEARQQAIEVIAQPGCRDRSHKLADRAVAVAQARRDPSADIQWCEGGIELALIAGQSTDGEAAAQVVSTVHFDSAAPGQPASASTVVAPSGFTVIPGEPRGERVLLRYSSPSSAAEVRVLVQGGDGASLERYAALSSLNGGWRGQRAQVGPWPAFVLGRSWATAIYLQYDDHTTVSITGEGLTDDEVRAVAASLGPADPELAPEVAPELFTRLANPS